MSYICQVIRNTLSNLLMRKCLPTCSSHQFYEVIICQCSLQLVSSACKWPKKQKRKQLMQVYNPLAPVILFEGGFSPPTFICHLQSLVQPTSTQYSPGSRQPLSGLQSLSTTCPFRFLVLSPLLPDDLLLLSSSPSTPFH